MTLFSERRLLHYTLEQIQKMRAAAGASNMLTNQTSGNTALSGSQSATNNAVAQEAARQASLAAKTGGGNAGFTYIDPNTGVDIRFVTKEGIDTRKLPTLMDDGNGNLIPNPNYGVMVNGGALPFDPYAKNPKKDTTPGASQFNTAGLTGLEIAQGYAAQQQEVAAKMQQQKLQQEMDREKANAQSAGSAMGRTASDIQLASQIRAEARQKGLTLTPEQVQQEIATRKSQGATGSINSQPPSEGSTTTNGQSSSTDASTPQKTGTGTSTTPTVDENGNPIMTPQQTANNASNNSVFSALIAATEDPMMKAVLMAMQNEADALGAIPVGQEQSFDQFSQANAGIGKPYDAIQKILDNSQTRIQNSEAATKNFLTDQYNRTNQFNALQKENIQAQLQWQQDKATRDQADINKKNLDRMTISLALRGGFGSEGGNNAIAEARMKGEQAIIDLQKEFGFKRADVSLQFTQLTNEASENYKLQWLQATDNFESRLAEIDMQGISNQQAKSSAISGAYKDYMTEIKDARKAHTDLLKDATKYVTDALAAERKAKQDNSVTTKDKLSFTSSIRGQIQSNKTITQANDANGFYNALEAAYNYYQDQLTDPTLSQESRNAAQTAVIGSFARILDPNSVVRNEEYERQVYGQSWINTVYGLFEKASTGGSGMTEKDINAMKHVADQIHESWEKRLDESMSGFIMDIDDWNANAPDQFIPYEQLLPVDRMLLPTQEFNDLDTRVSGNKVTDFVSPPADFNSWITMTGNGQVVSGSPYHTGIDQYAIDIDGNDGDPVIPVVGGMVTSVGKSDTGYGNSVIITDDEGNEHLYGHLDTIDILQGQRVEPGQVFATMGHTGKVIPGKGGNGSHLHYRVSRSGQAIALDSITPVASAPVQQPNAPMMLGGKPIGTGQTAFNLADTPNAEVVQTPAKKYRNIQTGAIVTVQSGQDDPYIVRPYQFTPIS